MSLVLFDGEEKRRSIGWSEPEVLREEFDEYEDGMCARSASSS